MPDQKKILIAFDRLVITYKTIGTMNRRFKSLLSQGFSLAMLLLLSCDDTKTEMVPEKIENSAETSAKITSLANKIYSDPDFKVVEATLVNKMKNVLGYSTEESRKAYRALTTVPLGKKLSPEASQDFVQNLGFKNVKDLSNYLTTYSKVLSKYSNAELSADEANSLEKMLVSKTLDSGSPQVKELTSIVNDKLRATSSARTQATPECNKCSFDFINCTQGFVTGMYTTNVTMGYGPFGTYLVRYLVTFATPDNSYSVNFVVTIYEFGIVTVNNASYSPPNSCAVWYHSCLDGNSCNSYYPIGT